MMRLQGDLLESKLHLTLGKWSIHEASTAFMYASKRSEIASTNYNCYQYSGAVYPIVKYLHL